MTCILSGCFLIMTSTSEPLLRTTLWRQNDSLNPRSMMWNLFWRRRVIRHTTTCPYHVIRHYLIIVRSCSFPCPFSSTPKPHIVGQGPCSINGIQRRSPTNKFEWMVITVIHSANPSWTNSIKKRYCQYSNIYSTFAPIKKTFYPSCSQTAWPWLIFFTWLNEKVSYEVGQRAPAVSIRHYKSPRIIVKARGLSVCPAFLFLHLTENQKYISESNCGRELNVCSSNMSSARIILRLVLQFF